MEFIADKKNAIATIISYLLLITGIVLIFFKSIPILVPAIVFGIGTLIANIEAFYIAIKNKTTDIRISRLHRINFLSTLTLDIATAMIYTGSTSWVAMVILFVLLKVFLVVRWEEK